MPVTLRLSESRQKSRKACVRVF